MTHPNQLPNQLPPNPGGLPPEGYTGLLPDHPGSPQNAPSAKPKRPKRFGWVAASLFFVGGLGLGALFAGGGEPAATVTERVVVTATVTAHPPIPGVETSSPPPAKKPAQPKIDATISNGLHEVGVDVQAGQYKTKVPDGDSCYWARNKDDSGDSIIANQLVDGPARQSVTIRKGEFFETEDCGTWQKVG